MDFKKWEQDKTRAFLPMDAKKRAKMGRPKQSELWRYSYLAYIIELRGYNYKFIANALGVSYNHFVKLMKNPGLLNFAQVKKIAALANLTFIEAVAIIEFNLDKSTAKYTTEFFYKELLTSKNIHLIREIGRQDLNTYLNPFEFNEMVSYYENKKREEEFKPMTYDPVTMKRKG